MNVWEQKREIISKVAVVKESMIPNIEEKIKQDGI